MQELSKTLIVLGLLVTFAGIIIYFGGQIGLGRLPGDIIYRGRNFTLYLPLATSILVSLFLSLLYFLLRR
jgi:hypothetical protein